LKTGGRTIGTFNLYVRTPEFFDATEMRLLNELASDISFALQVCAGNSEREKSQAELRASEERFRQLAETIEEVFWMTDATENRLLYVSPAYEITWGRSCASLYENPHGWIEAVHPEDRARVFNSDADTSGSHTYDEEFRILRPDGTERWIHERAFPVRNDAGESVR
jgi:two-component system cell cycle sensor histidine kinase/response regulator CckA